MRCPESFQKADKALAALKKLSSPVARAIRDGSLRDHSQTSDGQGSCRELSDYQILWANYKSQHQNCYWKVANHALRQCGCVQLNIANRILMRQDRGVLVGHFLSRYPRSSR
jgi:hypothetical protein